MEYIVSGSVHCYELNATLKTNLHKHCGQDMIRCDTCIDNRLIIKFDYNTLIGPHGSPQPTSNQNILHFSVCYTKPITNVALLPLLIDIDTQSLFYFNLIFVIIECFIRFVTYLGGLENRSETNRNESDLMLTSLAKTMGNLSWNIPMDHECFYPFSNQEIGL